MRKFKNHNRFKTVFVFLFCIMFSREIFADSSCGTFVIKFTFYTNSGIQDSGYTLFKHYRDGVMRFNFIDEYQNIILRIHPDQIDYGKIKGWNSHSFNKLLAVNRSVMTDTCISADFNGDFDLKVLPFADNICELHCYDTINYSYYNISGNFNSCYSLDSAINQNNDVIHYAKAKYLNLDTVKVLIMDSVLWCGDNDQLQFLTANQTKKISSGKIYSHFRLADSGAQQFAIDFFCFDPKLTKSRILSLLDLAGIDNDLLDTGGDNIFNIFPSVLKQAIKLDKVVYFVRWSP